MYRSLSFRQVLQVLDVQVVAWLPNYVFYKLRETGIADNKMCFCLNEEKET